MHEPVGPFDPEARDYCIVYENLRWDTRKILMRKLTLAQAMSHAHTYQTKLYGWLPSYESWTVRQEIDIPEELLQP